MKKIIRTTFLAATLLSTSLFAQVDQENLGSENINQHEERTPGRWNVLGNYDWIGSTKVDRRPCKGHIDYAQGEVGGSTTIYYNCDCHEGLNVGAGWQNTHLHWAKNPYFRNQKYWNTFYVNTNFFTHRAEGWLWLAQAQINMNTNHWNFNEYTTYDLLLWGRYDYTCDVGLHVGFAAQTGMKVDHVLPIIGFDWQYNEDIKINAVFPVNISAVYTINENLSAAVAARYFSTRQRAGKNEPVPESLFYYRATGFEGALNYVWDCGLNLNVHAGWLAGGVLRIGNREWRSRKNICFNGAPYAGGAFAWNF